MLVVGRLAVQSSYLRNEEGPATPERFDTVQWWLGPLRAWRVRTYAADLDIHLHALEPRADLERLAVRNILDTYAEVLERVATVRLDDFRDAAHVERQLVAALGAGGLEVADRLDLAFWNPGALRFSTQSAPR